jgi:hypothetical protein
MSDMSYPASSQFSSVHGVIDAEWIKDTLSDDGTYTTYIYIYMKQIILIIILNRD